VSRRGLHPAVLSFVALLASAPGCGLKRPIEGLSSFETGKEAALSSNHAAATDSFTLAIESSHASYFFTEAYLARGDSWLALATEKKDRPVDDEKLELALEDFDRVLAQPEVKSVHRTRALSSKGKALLARDDKKGAEEVFREVLAAEEVEEGELEPYRLEAHRRLGWIECGRAQELLENAAPRDEPGINEQFRVAQEQFSSGLEIDPEDWDLNLGKGMCLLFREQRIEARSFLEKSTTSSSARGALNPRGWYYLARALEDRLGAYSGAPECYRKALLEDTERSFRPLYTHLAEVLLDYMSPDTADFSWFLDQLLAYRPEDPKYWEGIQALGTKIASRGSPPEKKLGTFTLALARARSGQIEEIEQAARDALSLEGEDEDDFLQFISRIFPSNEGRPEYLYGKALALFDAGRHEELESFFREGVFATLNPAAREKPAYEKTRVIEGRNIVARWREETAVSGPPETTDAKLERDKKLGRARDSFVAYLDRHPADHDVRMALGEVQEMLEAFPAAFASYEVIVRDPDPEYRDRALLQILRLHSGKLLREDGPAWNLLRSFSTSSDNAEIKEYVRAERDRIEEEIRLYCTGCGRKGAVGDRICIECGRNIGKVAQTTEVR
jgi:tetratricopeptide (TPR) repeat protein